MDIQITLLSRYNLHLLDAVEVEVFDAPIDRRLLPAYLADPAQRLFLAVRGGVVVGQLKAIVHRHPEKPPALFVEELGVSPAHQRNGIATALMNAAATLSENLGCTEVWLATEPDNAPANAFYKAYGMTGQHVVLYSRQREIRDEASPSLRPDT